MSPIASFFFFFKLFSEIELQVSSSHVFFSQCEKEFHVGCLRDSGLCDLKVIDGKFTLIYEFCLR